jgi:tripartite-type tricarboxylate transporter receptor subunit TctC
MEEIVKRLSAACLALAGVCVLSDAHAQAWPNRPVRIVNTFAAGGAADFLARTIADNLSKSLRQQFFVETRPGAAGAIGVQSVVATPPDGYNFVITNITMLALAPISNPKLGYNPDRDLTNVAFIGGSPIVLSVNAKSGIKTLKDFVAYAKKSGKPMTYSSSGVGSSGHLFGESLGHRLNVKVEHVPYKGASQGLLDLVAGHIMFSAQTVTSSAGQMRGGTLHGVAVTAKQRMSIFPDMPTFVEQGYPEFVTSIWFSLSGPKGLPNDIVMKMNREIGKVMAQPAIAARMTKEGMITESMTPAEFEKFVQSEKRYWRPVIEKAGLIRK